ncbi:SpoIIE family protein phosphatase [Streptomyces sp. NPDC088350]|uniref:SpoIIE family protein phosphatase n=1 Tax=Streptomyces sp. NPDC088350 TaxID=3365854 RepID=UPI00380ACB72
MGRLRTTVRAPAALDLAPDELLAGLDDLLARVGSSSSADNEQENQAPGATCLYVVYDPVSRHCFMARAGHPPPILVRADGDSEIVSLPPTRHWASADCPPRAWTSKCPRTACLPWSPTGSPKAANGTSTSAPLRDTLAEQHRCSGQCLRRCHRRLAAQPAPG